MNQKEFEEKYKNFSFPKEMQETFKKIAEIGKIVMKEYEEEYEKIQQSYASFFNQKGIIKPYDINDFFRWIAYEYPDENLSFIVEVAKNPNSYKMFHDYKLNLFNGNDNITTNLNALSINEIFDYIRSEDVAESDIYKLLKNYTEDFDSAIVKSVLKDLEFYLFVEKEEMEAQFTYEEVDSAIALRKEKGLEIPYHKRIEPNELTEKQKQNRKKAEERGFIFNRPIINKEQLLFPYEFMNIYRLKNLLNSKLKQDNEKSTETIIHSGNDDTTKNIDADTGIDKDLLNYLSENFRSTDKRFNDLTKYNQIYRVINKGREYNIEHRAYKKLIKELFGFDYLNREIKGVTQKHQTQLEKHSKNYNDLKK